jgi:hypothetical protein
MGLDKTVTQKPCRSYSMSSGSVFGAQDQNARAMLIDAHLSAARSGVEVLVARCFVSGLREQLCQHTMTIF